MKTQYVTQIPLRIKDNPTLPVIHVMGRSIYQAVVIEPAFMELDPILPKSFQPTVINFTVRNQSENPIEIYSLEFDTQYVLEEKMLRALKSYNKDNMMHAKVREPSEPFWEDLAVEASSAAAETTGNGKIPTPQVAAQTLADDKPKRGPKGVDPSKMKGGKEPMITNDLREKSLAIIIVIYGAPFSGKTTQAQLLAKRYKCPLINVTDIILSAVGKGTLKLPAAGGVLSAWQSPPPEEVALSKDPKGKLDLKAKGATLPAVKGVDQESGLEKDIEARLKARIQETDCTKGFIIDGLSSNYLPVLKLMRCILNALGLQSFPGTLVTPPKAEGEPGTTETRVVWKGDSSVYVIAMKARKRKLYQRFEALGDNHHARARKTYQEETSDEPVPMLDVDTKNCASTLSTVEIIPYAMMGVQEAKGDKNTEIDRANIIAPERLYTPYPYILAYPTPEEVDRHYNTEGDVLAELGGILSLADVAALGTNLILTIVDAMQEIQHVFQDGIDILPLAPDDDTRVPPPTTFQVVKRPPLRTIITNPDFPFSFLTKLDEPASPPSPKGSGAPKDAKAKGGKPIDAKGAKGVKTTNVTKSGDVSAHDIAHIGYVKQTRWVIPGKGTINLALLYWSRVIEEFECVFNFEVLGGQGHAELQVMGICDLPRIQLYLVTFPSRKHHMSPCFGVKHKEPPVLVKIPNGVIDFGPMNTALLPNGYPNIPDTNHSMRLYVENVGQFDLHVDFQLIKGEDAPTSPVGPETVGKGPPTKKAGQPESPIVSKTLASGSPPFILHPSSMDIKINGAADLCIYSYPTKVNRLQTL